MLKRKGIIVMLLALLSYTAYAQPRRDFSEDTKLFPNELKEYFATDRREEATNAINTFLPLWESKSFSEDEMNKIMEFSNTMLRQRMKVLPEFASYIRMLTAYKANKLPAEKFTQYHEVADLIISKTKKDFKDFTETCRTLFEDLTVFALQSKNWKVSNSDYSISFVKNEPIFTFKAVELQLYTRADTMGVYQTSGIYSPVTNKWTGTGGMVYWTRVGFARERAFAKLKKYNINLLNSDYAADSVEFNFPKVFTKPILGRLQDKATTEYLGVKASYPRFKSYQAVFEIKNIFQNVDYRGGFTLEGPQILGTGTDQVRAQVTIKQNNKVVLKALSSVFVIDPDKISSAKSAISLYLGKDSIYHSQLIFSYLEKSRLLNLSRDNSGLGMSPFFDNYHQVEFNVGNIVWKVDSANVLLRTVVNPDNPAIFESSNYYQQDLYVQQQKLLTYNPLERLKKLAEGNGRIITEKELAAEFNNKIENLYDMLFHLALDGFIFYDIEGKTIIVKDKLIHYGDAYKNAADYDNIKFASIIRAKPNGIIDLKTLDMNLEGVPQVRISDSQDTYFAPYDQKITFHKNRDIAFGGHVHSGRFDFYGMDFTFNYDKFNVTLSKVDSVKFKFPEFDSTGKQIGMRMIQNTIQDVNGFLYIDEPNNKSGKHPVEKYPIFNCNKKSFVYYDKKSIYNGVYDRKRFYFSLDTFTIRNLDKFTAQGLKFPGELTSADIVPVIRHPLTVQKDFSLGFEVKSPEPKGYVMYKGKGIGKGIYMLSNSGFRENGEIAYLTSKTISKNFLLFPDSMHSHSESFDIPELAGGKYPPVSGKGVINMWKPYKDSMYVYKDKSPISVYAGKIDFSGSFILTPKELVGNGNMAYQNLNIKSEAFAFLPTNIKTKEGDVSIKSETSARQALSAKDMTVDLDLNKDFGRFKANDDTSKVLLPSNKYATTLNNFTYDLKAKQIDFVKSAAQDEEEAYFIASNPGDDNLKFNSKKASYNLNQGVLKAEDVPFILVADSKIFPPGKTINIEKEGNLGSIKDAEIITDAETENHKIYGAFVNIFSKTKFTGYGKIDYIDRDKKKFVIPLTDIRTSEDGKTTIAKGTLTDTSHFYLGPRLGFTGSVNLLSTRKEFNFDGLCFPEHKISGLISEGVKVNTYITAEEVVLDIPAPKAADGKDLYAGTFISTDSNKIYNVFFGRKKNEKDVQVFATTGVLMYDAKLGEFQYGPKDKVAPENMMDQTRDGNLFKVIPATSKVYTEGLYNFGTEYKHVKLKSGGSYEFNYLKNTNLFNVALLADFPIGADPGKMWTDSLIEGSHEAENTENSDDKVLNSFIFLGSSKKEKDKAVADLNAGVVPTSGSFDRTLVLSELNLKWVDSTKAFVSVGKIGVANVKNVLINKRMDGVVEIARSPDGDKFNLLLTPNGGSFVYFGYVAGDMYYLASDLTLVDKITASAKKVEKSNKGFRLKLGSMNDVQTLWFKKGNS